MALKVSDLANHSWKPCTWCYLNNMKCQSFGGCGGHGVEPVAVENELVEKMIKHGVINEWKLQVGVAFMIRTCHPKESTHDEGCCMKFLPLYPKVKGDNSVMMVVKTNG